MSVLTIPNTLVHDTLADAAAVMGNFNAIPTVVNGNLESSTNVKVAVPIAQTSAAIAQGSSVSLARADHAHVIQGFEQLTSDPTTGNFVGRCYNNTSTLKIRQCIATGGSGTWITIGNLTAADLPAHASNHTTGSDQLNPPMCLATRTATQSITNNTATAVLFNATDLSDTDTMHDTVTNNDRITAKTAGMFLFTANVAFAANNTGLRTAQIQHSGGAVIANFYLPSTTAGTDAQMSLSGYFKMAVNDWANLVVLQNSGGALNIQGAASTDACVFGAAWQGVG